MQNEDLTAATTPFKFRLHNRQGQDILYTRLPQQFMTLELRNTSMSPLMLAESESDYHFLLRFRPGTLFEHEKIKLNEKDNVNWVLITPTAASAGEAASGGPDDVILNLRYKGASTLPLDPGKRISISLQNIVADGRSGAHSTRVELKYQKLVSEGNGKPLNGTCTHHLTVLDESPND